MCSGHVETEINHSETYANVMQFSELTHVSHNQPLRTLFITLNMDTLTDRALYDSVNFKNYVYFTYYLSLIVFNVPITF